MTYDEEVYWMACELLAMLAVARGTYEEVTRDRPDDNIRLLNLAMWKATIEKGIKLLYPEYNQGEDDDD